MIGQGHIHSSVSGLIEYHPSVEYVTHEEIVQGQTALYILWSADYEVHGKLGLRSGKNLQGLPDTRSLESKYYKQIDIRVTAWHPMSVGAEQDDSLRFEFGGNAMRQFLNTVSTYHTSVPIME
jgi:hypothetical protein